jgi:hypothetical protein
VHRWGLGHGCSLPPTGDRYVISDPVRTSIFSSESLYDEDSMPPSVSSSLSLFPSVTAPFSFALPRAPNLPLARGGVLALDPFSRPSGAGFLCHHFIHLTPSTLLPTHVLTVLSLTVVPT